MNDFIIAASLLHQEADNSKARSQSEELVSLFDPTSSQISDRVSDEVSGGQTLGGQVSRGQVSSGQTFDLAASQISQWQNFSRQNLRVENLSLEELKALSWQGEGSLLLIDAASHFLIVAAFSQGRLLWQDQVRSQDGARQLMAILAKRLLGSLEETSQSGTLSTPYWRPDRLLVGSGPGSYTGLRIAHATAASLAMAWKISLGQVSSLAAYALKEGLSLAGLDARAGGLYAQLFVDGLPVSGSFRLSNEQLQSFGLKEEIAKASHYKGSLDRMHFVTNDASLLKERHPSIDWIEQEGDLRQLETVAREGFAQWHRSPFTGFHFDYLKEDSLVPHSSASKQ